LKFVAGASRECVNEDWRGRESRLGGAGLIALAEAHRRITHGRLINSRDFAVASTTWLYAGLLPSAPSTRDMNSLERLVREVGDEHPPANDKSVYARVGADPLAAKQDAATETERKD